MSGPSGAWSSTSGSSSGFTRTVRPPSPWMFATIPNWDNPNSGLPERLLFLNGTSFRMPKSLRTPRQELLQSLLADARKAKGMTQADVAKTLGQPQSFLAKYANGGRPMELIEIVH